MITKIEVKQCVLQPSPAPLFMSDWHHCNQISVGWLGWCFVFPAAQHLADRKHQSAMADPHRTAASAGPPWASGCTWRSRHVHVRDGLQPEAVPSPAGRRPSWGRRRLAALPSQCKLRTLRSCREEEQLSRRRMRRRGGGAWLEAGVGFSLWHL